MELLEEESLGGRENTIPPLRRWCNVHFMYGTDILFPF